MSSHKPAGNRLFWLVAGIALLHHADHVLRVDHSGWPFVPAVSPFTYSLAAYPVLVFIYTARKHPWYRVAATALLLLFSTAAHIFFEPLSDKYRTWTYGSNLPHHAGEKNLLGLQSKWLGMGSVALAVLLSVVLLLLLIASVKEALRQQNERIVA